MRDKATAYALCPNKKLKGAKDRLEAEWVVLRDPDTLVMHQDAQVPLVLKRRAAEAKPRASFPCEKAGKPDGKGDLRELRAGGLGSQRRGCLQSGAQAKYGDAGQAPR